LHSVMHPTRPRRPNRVRRIPERYGLPPVAAPVVVPNLPPPPLDVFVRKYLVVIKVAEDAPEFCGKFNLSNTEFFSTDPVAQVQHDLDKLELDTHAFSRMGCAPAGKYYWRSYTMDRDTNLINWHMKGCHERYVAYDTNVPDEIVFLTRGSFPEEREAWVFKQLERAIAYCIPPWTTAPGYEYVNRSSQAGTTRGMLVGPHYISAHRYNDLARANNMVLKPAGEAARAGEESRGATARCSIM